MPDFRAQTRVAAVLIALLTVPSPQAQETSRYDAWQNPDDEGSARGGDDESLQRLLEELESLVDEADRARAADPRFLSDLRRLVGRYQWPWQVDVIDEDFTDGGVRPEPQWRVIGGDVQVVRNVGLHSVVRPPERSASESGSTSGEELAAALLSEVFGQRSDDGGGAAATPATRADVHAATRITNAFALDATVDAESAGRLELGVYQQRPLGSGYRLAWETGAQTSLELLRATSRGVSVIDRYTAPAGAGGRDGVRGLQWTRDERGVMTVRLDGETVLTATDRGFQDPFDGVVVSNLGGEFAVRELRVASVPAP